MDIIGQAATWANSLTGGNQSMSAAIVLWFLGTLTIVLRSIPKKIWDMIRYQAMFRVNGYKGSSWVEDHVYQKMVLFGKLHVIGGGHSASLNRRMGENSSTVHELGVGFHLGVWKSRPILIYISEIESSGVEVQKMRITISLISTNRKLRAELVETFMVSDDNRAVYMIDDGGLLEMVCPLTERRPETIVTNDDVHLKIASDIDWFVNNREWYIERGLAYKLVILLEGPYGTGKSSIVRFLATKLDSDLHLFPPTWTPMVFRALTPSGAETLGKSNVKIVAMEDFDRTLFNAMAEPGSPDKPVRSGRHGGRTDLNILINLLDGPYSPEGVVIVMTVNDMSKLDPVILRDSRIDRRYTIDLLNNESVHRYIEVRYPNDAKAFRAMNLNFQPIGGSTLHMYYTQHPYDMLGFIQAVSGHPGQEGLLG